MEGERHSRGPSILIERVRAVQQEDGRRPMAELAVDTAAELSAKSYVGRATKESGKERKREIRGEKEKREKKKMPKATVQKRMQTTVSDRKDRSCVPNETRGANVRYLKAQ